MAGPDPAINTAISIARMGRESWQDEAGQALLAAGQTEWDRAVLCDNQDYQQALRSLKSPMMVSARLAFIRKVEELHTLSVPDQSDPPVLAAWLIRAAWWACDE